MVTPMERISTGIDLLDSKISGGYPKNKGILIVGTPGTGKTILGLHSIHKCCTDGKKCVIIATEESDEDILQQAQMLGLDLSSYYESGQLIIEPIFENRLYSVVARVTEIDILDIPALIPDDTELVLFDNLGVFCLDLNIKEFRGRFDALTKLLSNRGCTTLFVMDKAAYDMTNQIADYSVYGSIHLQIKENPYTSIKERYLSIEKMRSTKITLELNMYDITSDGIVFGKPQKPQT